MAFSLADRYPLTVGEVGSVEFDASSDGDLGGLAGIGLRFNPNGSFTSVPLIWSEDSHLY